MKKIYEIINKGKGIIDTIVPDNLLKIEDDTLQNNIPLKVEILSTDLATNDISGFVDYFNSLNPNLIVSEVNSIVQFLLTDTNDIYQLTGIGKGTYGDNSLQITSVNVLKFSLSNEIPTLQEVLDNNHDLVDGNNFQGTLAGNGNSGVNVIGIGDGVAQANSGSNIVSIGSDANCAENTGNNVIALGSDTASANSGNNVVALGFEALNDNSADDVIAIGQGSSQSNSGTNLVALGSGSAQNNSGDNVNAFGGNGPAAGNIGDNVNAIGNSAAQSNTADHVNALGQSAGINNTFKNVNLFGYNATADAENQTVFSKWVSGVNKYLARLSFNNITGNRKWELPDADGTLALTSDITTPKLQEVTDEGNETTDEIIINNWKSKNYDNILGVYEELSTNKTATLKTQEGITNLSEWEIKPYSGVFAFESDIPTIQAGTNITIDDTDPLNPIINASGGSSGIPHATASGTDTYTATVTGVTAYNDADAYLIRFTNGNTTGATLNINSLGAIPLYKNNDGVLIGGDIIDGGEMLCIYNSTNNNFQVIGTAPNSLFSYVTNDDSVTLTKGMPVYAFSGTGDRMTVKRANNTGDATSAQTVGLVLSTSIAAGQKGLIMIQGLLDGLSILPTSTFADGDAVYLGATAGTITNVKPYAPNHLVYLGVVTTASNGSSGRMYVRIQNGYELSEIHDIDLITNAPTNNQALIYESSTDLWKNKTIIQDSISDGVTTVAPSQNAVFDALGGLTSRINQSYTIIGTFTGTSPADATTYYIGPSSTLIATTEANRRWQFPYATTIRTLSIALGQTSAGTSEAVSVYLRNLTAGTETLVGTFTSNFTAGTAAFFNFSGLNISIPNTTDNWTLKIVTPTWATNPTAWTGSFFVIAN